MSQISCLNRRIKKLEEELALLKSELIPSTNLPIFLVKYQALFEPTGSGRCLYTTTQLNPSNFPLKRAWQIWLSFLTTKDLEFIVLDYQQVDERFYRIQFEGSLQGTFYLNNLVLSASEYWSYDYDSDAKKIRLVLQQPLPTASDENILAGLSLNLNDSDNISCSGPADGTCLMTVNQTCQGTFQDTVTTINCGISMNSNGYLPSAGASTPVIGGYTATYSPSRFSDGNCTGAVWCITGTADEPCGCSAYCAVNVEWPFGVFAADDLKLVVDNQSTNNDSEIYVCFTNSCSPLTSNPYKLSAGSTISFVVGEGSFMFTL